MTQPTHPAPSSLGDLFMSFTRLALQGFGGVLAFMERTLVEQKKWMTREEFVQEWAVARTMPGPPAMNLSIMVGTLRDPKMTVRPTSTVVNLLVDINDRHGYTEETDERE